MTILFTNDPFDKMADGRTLYDTVRDGIFLRSRRVSTFKKPGDVPDDVVYQTIEFNFGRQWDVLMANLNKLNGEEYLALVGRVGRWDGPRWFCRPFGEDTHIIGDFLKDCEEVTVEEDEQGSLHITGVHHDGTNTAAVMIISQETYEKIRDGESVNPDGPGVTKPLEYTKRFGKPGDFLIRSESWLWEVIVGLDEETEWLLDDDDDASVEYFEKELEGIESVEKAKIDVMEVASGVTEEREGQSLIAFSGGLNGPGKWTDYLQALKDIAEKLDGRLIEMKIDDLDDVFYAVFSARDKEE